MKQTLTLLPLFILLFTACSPKVAETTATTPNVPATPEVKKDYAIKVLEANLPSPRKEMTGKIDGIDVTINYGSPSVKGRQILNNLIPYGKVWRTGANEATTFEINQNIKVEGKTLNAGKYSLFTLNNEGNTTIIFNSIHDQWGAYSYDESKDVLRINVRPSVTETHTEMMDFQIIGNTVLMVWEKVAIPFDVEKG